VQENDIKRLEMYLKRAFTNGAINVKARKQEDSAEVYIGDEFIGVVYEDTEEEDGSFTFNMAILAEDLP